MKKTLLSVLLALSLVVMAACGSTASTAPSTGGTAPSAGGTSAGGTGETYVVYLITMDQMDMHWVKVNDGCEAAVKEINDAGNITIEYHWDAPTDGKNTQAQIECINNAVANNADLILLASNGPDEQVAAIEEAMNSDVKFIYVDSPANVDVYQTLATDNTAAGKTAGEEMIAQLEADGITEGDIGIVNVNPSTTSTVQREEGFRSAFEGTDFTILETQYGEGQIAASQEIANNYITQGVVGIFGTNEGGTTGVGNAIAENNTGIVGVGFDTSEAVLDHVADGNLLCTMAQNPYVMGYEGIKSAEVVLTGGTPSPAVYDTGVTVVNKDNEADFR